MQHEVIHNIRNQAIGSHRVADLALPADFLGRIANRIERAAFEREFRQVVRDDEDGSLPRSSSSIPSIDPEAASSVSALRVVRHLESPADREWRDSLVEGRPTQPGFRAPIFSGDSNPPPIANPAALSAREQQAALHVATRLASDGSIRTLAGVMQTLGTELDWSSPHASTERLQVIGFPCDVLAYFTPPASSVSRNLIQWLCSALTDGKLPGDSVFTEAVFQFTPSAPGFAVASESGEHDAASFRLHWTRGSHWQGPGDGGNLDLTQQLMEKCARSTVFIHVESKFASEAQRLLTSWGSGYADRVTLIIEPRTVSQWAHDNGKVGFLDGRVITLAPRFASRGEDGSTFVPGDTFLLESLRQAGNLGDESDATNIVRQSPLLFQGGNLLAVTHPKTGERILLIGEAEIHRNIALGLNRQQALEAFRIEFGVHRCEVLPGASFHLDYDLCVRAIGSRLVAFVNDHARAAHLIIECGLEAMVRHALIDPDGAQTAVKRLKRGDVQGGLEIVGPVIAAFMDGRGNLPLSLAEKFSVSPADSGVGNLHRFVLAIDLLTATITPPARLASIDPHGYYAALRRSELETAAFHKILAKIGFDVVKVPSLSAGDRSVNTINGIHLKSAYLMPRTDGLFAPVDRAAQAVFERHMGQSIAVVPIRTAESQRRNGAVHCSVSWFPKCLSPQIST